jgi:hypothetical protein
MRLPSSRGPMTAALFARLAGRPGSEPLALDPSGAQLADPDLQLALFTCYELHHQGFDGVDERWEWAPSLLSARAVLEGRFEEALGLTVTRPAAVPPERLRAALNDLAADDDGPSLSAYLKRDADLGQFREFVMHRSLGHLKEAGSELLRVTMRGLDLDDSYGAYLGRLPGITLAVCNARTMFGLHRRLRGALAGHLAALELTSAAANRRHAAGLRRLGGEEALVAFYEERARAGIGHEPCGGFAEAFPALVGDVLYGAACALALERRWSEHVMACWGRGTTSLADPCPEAGSTAGAGVGVSSSS